MCVNVRQATAHVVLFEADSPAHSAASISPYVFTTTSREAGITAPLTHDNGDAKVFATNHRPFLDDVRHF